MILRSTTRVSSRALAGRRGSGRRISGRHPHRLALMWLEERILLSGTMTDPVPLPIGYTSAGGLGPGGAAFYQIEPAADGLLTAAVHPESASLQLRLSLFDASGNLLAQSDGQSLVDTDPMIQQHLTAGAAELEVQGLSGSGTFALSTSLTPSSDPGQTVVLPPEFQEGNFAPIAVGDFTNNGILDIATPAGVYLGTGDGTFTAPSPAEPPLVDPSLGADPAAIAVGDFNGDNDLDAAVVLPGTDSVSISLGNGDGTFQAPNMITLPGGGFPDAIVAGDFGDGHVDLAVADAALNEVFILRGDGQGDFQLVQTVPVGQGPVAMAEGDFLGNGRTDIAVADFLSGDVTVLLGNGDGTFTPLAPMYLPAGSAPTAIVAANLGTGHLDLAVTNYNGNSVQVLQGNGDGTFQLASTLPVAAAPYAIAAGDFGNGHVDLAVADSNSNNVSVLMGNGDGTFQPAMEMAVGSTPLALVAGDFTGDGRLDLATGNAGSNDISVLLGKGDGTFEEPTANLVGYAATSLATGDFTGNGNLGLAVLNQGSDDVTILPGNGDGTFQQPLTVPLPQGGGPESIVAADFNDDGRTDLAVADPILDEVDILLGNGDGTFQALPPIPVAGGPYAIATGDFTGNGRVDLAVADLSFSTVTILLGNGDGTFTALPPIPIGAPNQPAFPDAIVAGHFVNGGPLDLAVTDQGTDQVTILIGNGDGTFQVAPPISLGGGSPSVLSLVAGDFTGDGDTDLAVASTDYYNGDSIDVLLGNGDGTFNVQPPMALGSGVDPTAIVAGDFTNSGHLDLATADANGDGTDDYSVYLGNGDGTFQPQAAYALGGPGFSTAIAVGDFTGDGGSDLAIARTSPDDVQVRLSNGDGTFSNPAVTDLVSRQTPVVADLNGDGTPDVSVVDAAGDILFRAGEPGEPGTFAPPITVNPGDPSRDIAAVDTDLGPLIASVDADDNALSFFAWGASGFTRVASLPTGPQPAQILAADLDGTGQTDLIVRNAGDGTLSIYMADGHGWFLPAVTLSVGLGASDVETADLEQDGRLDIVVTDRLSGEVEVLQNLGGGAFAPPYIEQAGPGPYGVTGSADPSAVTSLEGTTSVTSGVFTPGGLPSLVALNPGSNTFGLLAGLGGGRLSNATIYPTPSAPLVVRAVDFNGDGLDGLAILTADGLYIERSNGQGGFLPPTEIPVGFEPNGLTVADLTGNGDADLLVSDPRGDILVLLGNGDGTFSAPKNADQQVAMAVVTSGGSSPSAFVFADQLTDQVIVQTVGGGTTVLGDTATGLVSPGAVKLADLNGNGIPDLIVADSGSDDVLVYPGLGNGTFGPALNDGHGFFTGTDPVGITVADLTGNGRPDLIIANKGSNTVSILINEQVGNSFTFVPGPVLDAGVGPVATAVVDVPGSPLPDLLVADSGSNQVRLLQGLGNSSFNDQEPTILPVGTDPSQLYVGAFANGPGISLATINSGSNTVTVISGVGTAATTTETVPTGGIDPTAGLELTLPGSSFASLMVANNGDGNMSLLSGGAGGLALSGVVSSPGVPNPSSLALAGFNGGELEWYATSEGEASATLLGFQLEEAGGGIPSPGSGSSSPVGAESSAASAQLVSLDENSLALVGTLLTISLNSTYETEQTEGTAEAAAAATGSGPSAGQGPFRAYRRTDVEDEEVVDLETPPAAGAQAASPWARFVTGIDQALEELRDGADERLRQERASEEPAVSPGQTRLDLQEGAHPAGATTDRGPARPATDASRAIDAAMASLVSDRPEDFLRPRPSSTPARPRPANPDPDGPGDAVGAAHHAIGDAPHRAPIRAAMSIAGAMALAAAAVRARRDRSRRVPGLRWAGPARIIPGDSGDR